MKQMRLIAIPLLLLLSCNKENSTIEIEPPTNIGAKIRMIVGGKTFTASLYDNSTAEAFLTMLPKTINMSEINGNEKYYELPNSLPTATIKPGTIGNGDIMLYSSRTLVLFYDTFSTSYSYTRIGRVDNSMGLEAALGRDDVTVRFEQISEATQYTLTYNANGATSGSIPPAVTADEGTSVIISNETSLSRSGYTFLGWNSNTNGTGIDYPPGSSIIVNNNVTLYAKWDRVPNSNNALKITIGSTTFTATLATNATAKAFKAMLPLTLNMSDFNNNEKVCSLPHNLATSASNPRTIQTGDIMLYGSSSLVLFYETFSTSYSYTRIGQVDNISGLKTTLGTGNVTIKFELE